jgi:hypothetical protein
MSDDVSLVLDVMVVSSVVYVSVSVVPVVAQAPRVMHITARAIRSVFFLMVPFSLQLSAFSNFEPERGLSTALEDTFFA